MTFVNHYRLRSQGKLVKNPYLPNISYLTDSLMLDFDQLSLKSFFGLVFVIERTFMLLRHSVTATENETAFAFNPQQSDLFVTCETSFSIWLQHMTLLLEYLLNSIHLSDELNFTDGCRHVCLS